MPTQVELEVPLQKGRVEQGLPSEGKTASMQSQWAASKLGPCVQMWSIDSVTSPLSALIQPVLDRVGIAAPVGHLLEEGRATGKALCHQTLPHYISYRVIPQLLLCTHPLPQAQTHCSTEASS